MKKVNEMSLLAYVIQDLNEHNEPLEDIFSDIESKSKEELADWIDEKDVYLPAIMEYARLAYGELSSPEVLAELARGYGYQAELSGSHNQFVIISSGDMSARYEVYVPELDNYHGAMYMNRFIDIASQPDFWS